MKTECGPGMLSLDRPPSGPSALVWFYDSGRHAIVRVSDSAWWRCEDVPELERSLHDRSNPEVSVEAIDRWVLAQPRRVR